MKKKTAKRIAAAALCVLICAASCLAVFAAGKTYTVKECGNLQITLPDNMSAVTRSSKQDDPFFSLHSLDYNEVMKSFSNGQIYLQAMDNVEAITVTLSCIETEQSKSIGDYNRLSSSELKKVAQNFIGESGSEASYNLSTVDESNRSVIWLFFILTGKDGGSSFKQYQATTVHNGKSYSLTLFRNGGNVTDEDFAVLKSIVATVRFQDVKQPFIGSMLFYIIIGGVILALIILIVVLIIVNRAKKRRKKTQNDKILQELAGKYKTNRQSGDPHIEGYGDDFGTDETIPEQKAEIPEEAQEAEAPAEQAEESDYDLENFDDDVPDRKYSDEDIARLLGDIEDDENFIDTLPETQADSEELSEVRDSVIENDDEISEFFEDEQEPEASVPAAEEAEAACIEEPEANEAPSIAAVPPVFGFEEPEDFYGDEPEEPVESDETEDFEGAEEAPEEIDEEYPEEFDESSDEEPDDEPEEGSDTEPDETEQTDADETEPDDEFREFINDEVLAREESNQDRFKDSNDFFEEAPRKVMGVISSREIEEAEEYDVIGEVEQRAEELEKETPTAGESFSKAMKKVGGGFKSFFTHCGYFATNVRREIKRSRARKKRKKAEEERRRQHAERRQQSRERRRTDGGLVQVRSRGERRPTDRR